MQILNKLLQIQYAILISIGHALEIFFEYAIFFIIRQSVSPYSNINCIFKSNQNPITFFFHFFPLSDFKRRAFQSLQVTAEAMSGTLVYPKQPKIIFKILSFFFFALIEKGRHCSSFFRRNSSSCMRSSSGCKFGKKVTKLPMCFFHLLESCVLQVAFMKKNCCVHNGISPMLVFRIFRNCILVI